VRVRQHVNPLSQKYQVVTPLPEWSSVFSELRRPLHLDIGCARGKFLLNLAPLQPDVNFLGIEIRESLVVEANEQRDRKHLNNLHFFFCNINQSLPILLDSLPRGILSHVSIQFPDPWFKHRHSKRRVVQPDLVACLAEFLIPGGQVFLQSDVEAVALEMGDRFRENPAFQLAHLDPWLEANPFLVPTEREIATQNKNMPVYRLLFTRSTSLT
jgi:tRNA (guanine-N7-)-methyltransferase